MSLFDEHAGTEVFENRDVLLDEYIPDELVARDEQVEEYLKALMPVYDGNSPDHVFLYGPNGSGKTATTRFILRELRSSEQSHVDLSTVWLRCNSIGTDYMLAIQLANRILPEDKHMTRGFPESEVYDRLFGALEEIGGTVLVVLDEIDRIKDLDTFLYEVTRARSPGGRLDETKVGIVAISKDSTFYDNLSSDTKSSLNEKTIDFPAYDANQLRRILQKRIDEAFVDHAVEDDVVPLVAGKGAKFSGDARFALDILREAGDQAKYHDDDVVNTTHVEKATDEVLEDRVSKKLDNLNDEAKRVAYALATLAAEKTDRPRTKAVYRRYKQLAEGAGNRSPVSKKQVTDYLNQLEKLGVTTISENRGAGGRYNRHELRYTVDDLVAALEGFIIENPITEEIEGKIGDGLLKALSNDEVATTDGGEDE